MYHSYQVSNAVPPEIAQDSLIDRIVTTAQKQDGIFLAGGILSIIFPNFGATKKSGSWNNYIKYTGYISLALGVIGLLTSQQLKFGWLSGDV